MIAFFQLQKILWFDLRLHLLYRPCSCRFARIGCHWEGPFHEVAEHEANCVHPKKTGEEVMGALEQLEAEREKEKKLSSDIFALLSYEKITFNDLQLKPFRTDDFITRLYYETSRFTAFNQQWVIRARINSENRNPAKSVNRSLTYQLVAKNKLTSPMNMHFLALSGPFGGVQIKSKIYSHEFTTESTETDYLELPIDSVECNKLLASKTINFRLVMFQVTK